MWHVASHHVADAPFLEEGAHLRRESADGEKERERERDRHGSERGGRALAEGEGREGGSRGVREREGHRESKKMGGKERDGGKEERRVDAERVRRKRRGEERVQREERSGGGAKAKVGTASEEGPGACKP